jgi:phosphoribosyl 1,2-cyclic phosphodiesterase
VRAHFCGVRGSTPAPGADFLRYGGHTSCVALAHDDAEAPVLILDAGTGVRTATRLMGDGPFQGSIMFSHLHWDHVQGLPFFAAGDRDDARVKVLLPEQEDHAGASDVLARAMSPPHFPLDPSGLRGVWTFEAVSPGQHEIEGFSVLAREIPHKGGRTFGYRISDGRTTLAYMPDHWPTAFGPGPSDCGEYHPAALELATEADLLVHDAQLLTPEELAAEGRFGHSSARYAVELGRHAGARAVMLFHHRPDRTDDALDRLAHELRDTPEVTLAAQGAVWQP